MTDDQVLMRKDGRESGRRRGEEGRQLTTAEDELL
jgi:hypothetical protein